MNSESRTVMNFSIPNLTRRLRRLSSHLAVAASFLAAAAVVIMPARATAAGEEKPAEPPPPPSPAELVQALATYDFGADRAPVTALESFVREAGARDAALALEDSLLALIGSAATPAGARDAAMRLLQQLATPRIVPGLEQLLAKQPSSALDLLFHISGREADAVLAGSLTRVRGNDLAAAINMVGRRRLDAAVPELRRIAGRKDAVLASAALKALGSIGTVDALKALDRTKVAVKLPDERAWATLAAARRVAATNERKVAVKLTTQYLDRKYAPALRTAAAGVAIAAEGVDAWGRVADLLRDSDPEVALRAARLPATMPGDEAIERSGDMLAKLDPAVQRVLLLSFSGEATARRREVLIGALKSNDESVQLAALSGLGAIGDAAVIDRVLPLLIKGGAIADGATACLASIPDDAADEALRKELKGAPAQIRAGLLEALGRRVYTPAFADAFAATSDGSADVRRAAFSAVGALAGPEQIPDLMKLLLEAGSPADQRALQRALSVAFAATRDPAAAAELAARSMNAANPDQRTALVSLLSVLMEPRAVDALTLELNSEDGERRKVVLRALGSARNITFRPLLLEAAKSAPEPSERVLAVRALLDLVRETQAMTWEQKIADYETIWNLAERTAEKQAVVDALGFYEWQRPAIELRERLAAQTPAEAPAAAQ